MKEIIGADERCTNISLASFGICTDRPLMTLRDIKKEIITAFKEIYYYIFMKEDKTIGAPSLLATGGRFHPEIGKRIVNVKTLKTFINYITSNNIYGHYLISYTNHVIALHYLKNGDIYIVDTELKFVSSRRIESFYIIEDKFLDKVFLDFILNNSDDYRVQKI
jgi:hypothetical protein